MVLMAGISNSTGEAFTNNIHIIIIIIIVYTGGQMKLDALRLHKEPDDVHVEQYKSKKDKDIHLEECLAYAEKDDN